MRVFRIVLPVDDIDRATRFLQSLLGQSGQRVSAGRHLFDLGQMTLACYAPALEGEAAPAAPLAYPIHFAVHDLEAFLERAQAAGAAFAEGAAIGTNRWGERSFTCRDPFGNPLCFVEVGTEVTG